MNVCRIPQNMGYSMYGVPFLVHARTSNSVWNLGRSMEELQASKSFCLGGHGLLVRGQTGSSLAQLQLWVQQFRAPGLQVPLVGWHGRREEALQPRKGAADVQCKQAILVQPLSLLRPGHYTIILRSIEHIKDAPKFGCFRPAGNEAAPLLY